MPRKKTDQEFFGLHLAIAHDLEKYIKKRGYLGRYIFHRETTLLLLRIANRPEILTRQKSFEGVGRFCSLLAKHPDEILDVLSFIRKMLADWKKEQAGFVRIFLRTKASTSNLKGERVSVASLTDKELASHLTKMAGFEITSVSVKRERQRVARIDRGSLGFIEHPEVQQYYRDGKITPALEQLIRGQRKDKS